MAEKRKVKVDTKKIVIIIVAIIVIVLVAFGIYKVIEQNDWRNATNVEDIVIEESDSDSIKIEKIQAKIDLLNEDISKLQEELNTELEKLNSLYEEYVTEMNKYQTGTTATEETTQDTETE